jgi:hypothetical protein
MWSIVLALAGEQKRRLKRGAFRSITDLQVAINRFLEEHNQQSKPLRWATDPDKIIATVRRGHQLLDSIPSAAHQIRKDLPEI